MQKLDFPNNDVIDKIIDSFKNFKTIYFIENQFNLQDLFKYLLNYSGGNSTVTITAFSVSDEAIRAFSMGKELGFIKSLNLLLNKQLLNNKTGLSLFARNIADSIYLTDIHAKIILIENKDCKIIYVGSSNWGHNKRYEAGFVSIDNQIFDIYNLQVLNILNDTIKYD